MYSCVPLLLVQILHVCLLSSAAAETVTCRDGDGQEVDWFVALKQPKSLNYAYVSSNDDQEWKLGARLNSSGPVDATLMQTFKSQSQLLFAYNDEHPHLGVEATKYGHMKGVVMLSGSNGFWLIHSVPKYPFYPSDRPIYLPHEVEYGQSFLCISFHISQLDNIGQQLFVTKPPIYHANITQQLLTDYPVWEQLLHKKMSTRMWRQSEIQSAAGVKMLHFAKSPRWQQDIYESIVAVQLRNSLLVESFQHTRGRLDSNCSMQFKVLRINSLTSSVFGEKYTTGMDHSKWCVSKDAGSSSVCIGDMNRAKTQFERGGGLMCLRNAAVHRLFADAVGDFDSCPTNWLPSLLMSLLLLLVAISIVTATSAALIIFGYCRVYNRAMYQQI